jgi:hypothetical protein
MFTGGAPVDRAAGEGLPLMNNRLQGRRHGVEEFHRIHGEAAADEHRVEHHDMRLLGLLAHRQLGGRAQEDEIEVRRMSWTPEACMTAETRDRHRGKGHSTHSPSYQLGLTHGMPLYPRLAWSR